MISLTKIFDKLRATHMKNNLINKLKAYFEDKSEVIAVYLFGSHAKNKADRSSDVDIGILLDTNDRAIETGKRNQYLKDCRFRLLSQPDAIRFDSEYYEHLNWAIVEIAAPVK